MRQVLTINPGESIPDFIIRAEYRRLLLCIKYNTTVTSHQIGGTFQGTKRFKKDWKAQYAFQIHLKEKKDEL